MKYMLLLRSHRAAWEELGPDGQAALTAGYGDLHRWVDESGYLVDASPLEGPDTVTTVRVRDGVTATTDGPFAETKEHLVGYYILECADLDAAIEAALHVPDVRLGSVEILPLAPIPDELMEERT